MFRSLNKFKKFITLGLIAVLSMTILTGCGSKSGGVVMNPDGTMKSFTEENLEEGLYVKKGDLYYPVLNAMSSDTGQNFMWYTSFDQLIPEYNLADGDKIIFYNESEVPMIFTLWKMTDQNYSVGIRFVQDGEGGFITFPSDEQDYCSYSPVYEYVKSTVFAQTGTPRIKELNGTEFKETLLTPDGFLKGLTKDAMYRFYYYQGTVYKYVNIKADTHIFVEEYDKSTASYVELKAKVFEINLPEGMENGYWYFDGYGMMLYKGPTTDLIEDNSSSNNNILPDDELDSSEPILSSDTPQEESQEAPSEEVPEAPVEPDVQPEETPSEP